MILCRFARHPNVLIKIGVVELDGVKGHPVWLGAAYERGHPAIGVEINARGARRTFELPLHLAKYTSEGLAGLITLMLSDLDSRAELCA